MYGWMKNKRKRGKKIKKERKNKGRFNVIGGWRVAKNQASKTENSK